MKSNGKLQRYTIRNSAGLCEALFDEFDRLRSGEREPQQAAVVAKMAGTIIAAKRLELDAAQLVKDGLRIRPVLLESPRRMRALTK